MPALEQVLTKLGTFLPAAVKDPSQGNRNVRDGPVSSFILNGTTLDPKLSEQALDTVG